MTLVGVNPDQTREILRCKRELRPILPAFVVALVGCRGAEAESETDNETEDGEKELVDADCSLRVNLGLIEILNEATYGHTRIC